MSPALRTAGELRQCLRWISASCFEERLDAAGKPQMFMIQAVSTAIHDALFNQRLHKCFINLFRHLIPMVFIRCVTENGDKIPGILPGG